MNLRLSFLLFRRWLLMLFFFWHDKYNYANCRNTATLAKDPWLDILHRLFFPFFVWLRVNPALFERNFQIVFMKNIWLKSNVISITDSKWQTVFHQYSYDFWLWFPALSLGHLHNCSTLASHQWVFDLCDFGYPAVNFAF